MVCQGKLGYPLGPGEKPSFNNDLLPDDRVELNFVLEIPGRSQTSEIPDGWPRIESGSSGTWTIAFYYGIFWHHPMGTLILFQVLFDFDLETFQGWFKKQMRRNNQCFTTKNKFIQEQLTMLPSTPQSSPIHLWIFHRLEGYETCISYLWNQH